MPSVALRAGLRETVRGRKWVQSESAAADYSEGVCLSVCMVKTRRRKTGIWTHLGFEAPSSDLRLGLLGGEVPEAYGIAILVAEGGLQG